MYGFEMGDRVVSARPGAEQFTVGTVVGFIPTRDGYDGANLEQELSHYVAVDWVDNFTEDGPGKNLWMHPDGIGHATEGASHTQSTGGM